MDSFMYDVEDTLSQAPYPSSDTPTFFFFPLKKISEDS